MRPGPHRRTTTVWPEREDVQDDSVKRNDEEEGLERKDGDSGVKVSW
jgi:hypothetical protein